MTNYKFILLIIPFVLNSCTKKVDNIEKAPTSNPAEVALLFSVNVDPGLNGILSVVGTSLPIIINITSILPSSGVNIDVTVKKDLDGSVVFASSSSTLTPDNTININGLTPGVLCTATIVVTSKSNSTNSKAITFKLATK